jgi:PAS domain S-box-containing protein
VSAPSTSRPASPMTSSSVLRSSVQPIARHLCESAGAQICYLALVDRAGQAPRLIATSMPSDEIPSWRAIDGPALLRRALAKRATLEFHAGGGPALALPLMRDDRQVGAALLLFTTGAPIDTSRAAAAANLAACALDSVRQVATLHFQAEEIEERTRLREIQISRNLIRGIIDSVPMELALLDSEGAVLAANRALAERFGLEPATLVGMRYAAVLGSWEDSPAARTFATGQPQKLQRTLHGANGQALLEMISIPLLDHEGRPHQVVEVWEDITERVALQTQLVRVEKLAAIGQLASSIAHEVGNPLQAIQGFLSLFLEQCPPETPNRRFLELAEEEIDRIVQVLARLRDLYRPRADVVAPVEINKIIEGVLLLTGKQLERSRVRVLRELAAELPPVHGVADQIKQVLLNLVLNAAEAMGDGGLLHIQTYVRHEHTGGRGVVIAITDTGVGIPSDQLPYIFDGLHTTKERGMGLGLYTSKAIVERHMGRISAQSTPGEGTTFTIALPIGDEEMMA